MDVTFREFEPYYSLKTTSPFGDLPKTGSTRREDSEGERLISVETMPCPVTREESEDEEESTEEEPKKEEIPQGGGTKTQGELRVYQTRKKQNEGAMSTPHVTLVPQSPLSRSTSTPETLTTPTTDLVDQGDMFPLSSTPTALRMIARNNAGHPSDRFGFPHDIAQFVSYSNISSVHGAFIASLDTVSIPKCWHEAKDDPK